MLSLLGPNQGIRAKEGGVYSAMFSCLVTLMLLEMNTRLDGHVGVMRGTVFIQKKSLVHPSPGPLLILNTTFFKKCSVNDVVHWKWWSF